MAESKRPTDLVAASFEALDRYEAAQETLVAGGERPPAPGDIYVLEVTQDLGVEWVVVAHDPADASRFLLVPADGHVLAGSADVELADGSPAGALKLRCRFGTWTKTELLRPELRVGVVGTPGLVQARQRWLDLGDGGVTGDVLAREVDDDPGYQDWIDGVVAEARRALIEAQGSAAVPEAPKDEEKPEEEPVVARPWRPRTSAFLKVAAAIALVVAGAQLWRLSQKVGQLETVAKGAEERHGAEIRRLETEQERLTAERDRLRAKQQELEAAGAKNEKEANELRERVAELDRKLIEAERAGEVVNPVYAFFNPPGETLRGKVEIKISPTTSHLVVILPLRGLPASSKYQLVLRRAREMEPIWIKKNLTTDESGEIGVGLPVDLLKSGEYELLLLRSENNRLYTLSADKLEVSK